MSPVPGSPRSAAVPRRPRRRTPTPHGSVSPRRSAPPSRRSTPGSSPSSGPGAPFTFGRGSRSRSTPSATSAPPGNGSCAGWNRVGNCRASTPSAPLHRSRRAGPPPRGRACVASGGTHPLEELVNRLDERFFAQTVPDECGELRWWVRPSRSDDRDAGEHWRRKPVLMPGDGCPSPERQAGHRRCPRPRPAAVPTPPRNRP